MTRLVQLVTATLGCLALSVSTASAQSSSSTTATATDSPASSVAAAAASGSSAAAAAPSSSANSTGTTIGNVTVEGRVPAYANSTQSALNATIQAVWSTDSARGTLTQGLTTLRDERNETIYGVMLQFNETTANLNYSSTAIPWIAYVSCDSAVQTATVPSALNATAIPANGTSGENRTAPAFNLLQQAQDLGAAAVLLFSSQAQSCTLNATLFSGNASMTANATSQGLAANATSQANLTVPIFSTGSKQVADIISQQFGNVPESHRYFNSTLLTASVGNLSSILSSATNGSPEAAVATAVTNFLLGQIVPSYDPTDSSNGVVATIGRAPSSAPPTSSGRPAATGGASQNNGAGASSGASARGSQRGRSKVTMAVVGVTAGALLAGVGLLL
ncbi:hypothetical protein JCM3774_001124 [Rhodotorula dairenensis]